MLAATHNNTSPPLPRISIKFDAVPKLGDVALVGSLDSAMSTAGILPA